MPASFKSDGSALERHHTFSTVRLSVHPASPEIHLQEIKVVVGNDVLERVNGQGVAKLVHERISKREKEIRRRLGFGEERHVANTAGASLVERYFFAVRVQTVRVNRRVRFLHELQAQEGFADFVVGPVYRIFAFGRFECSRRFDQLR